MNSAEDKQDFDDPNIPEFVIIRYSLWKKGISLLAALICIGGGVYLVFFPKEDPWSWTSIAKYVYGTFMLLFSILWFWITQSDLRYRSPLLVIGEKGMKRLEGDWYSWDEISLERIILVGSGAKTYTLTYRYPRGIVNMTFDGLDIETNRLEYLLKVYRSRFERKNDSRNVLGIIH